MITFLICLTLLIGSYFVYGKYVERVFGADKNRPVPSETQFDGIDYVPMPLWRTFLIQLLNIAGLGPIFGAVLGAAYGPVAFIWITLGGIFFGAMHDYLAGMISLENGGQSLPEIIGKYLGLGVKQVMRVFILILMILVGAVFMTGPAGILSGLTEINSVEIFGYTVENVWIWLILIYYLIATLLPIDKVIGNIYPLFGAALIIMALGILYVLFVEDYKIPELTFDTMTNMKSNPEQFPIFTTLFITIACGALSGFHATQSPMMARCMKNERQGRFIFFGAMISESVIALIWAAVAMAFFGGIEQLNAQLAAHGNDATWAVELICATTLGSIGGILAMLGVVAAPISTGDTAFRSARLIVADFFGVEQRSLWKRVIICIPLFILGYGITLFDFDVIWRSFAWANQTIAVATLWAITVYLALHKKNYWVSLLPAIFMSFVVFSHFFSGSEMLGLPRMVGNLVASGGVILILVLFVRYVRGLK